MVAVGTTFTGDGVRYRLDSVLGVGGQGSVYGATRIDTGEVLALKWYNPSATSQQQFATIADLVERGSPHRRFLWPMGIITGGPDGSFGYLMAARPDGFVELRHHLNSRAADVDGALSPVANLRASVEIADSFVRLHTAGLCYRDINLGNFFIDPSSGAVLVCDNDNIGIDGVSSSNVLGTRSFMAPEIVRGECRPNQDTDLHSLAVLLFMLLAGRHPLRPPDPSGDPRAEADAYGWSPQYLLADGAALPAIRAADLWCGTTEAVRRAFLSTFTRALHEPGHRTHPASWSAMMLEQWDGTAECAACRTPGRVGSSSPTCWRCGALLAPPGPVLVIGRRAVPLADGKVVTSHHLHLDGLTDVEFAVALRHPHDPARLGLMNRSASPWTIRRPGVEPVIAPPGTVVDVRPGIAIDSPGVELAIR